MKNEIGRSYIIYEVENTGDFLRKDRTGELNMLFKKLFAKIERLKI